MRHFSAFFLVLFLSISMLGCGSSSSSSSQPTDLKSLYEDLADNVVLPNYRSAGTAAESVAGDTGAIQQYCDAIGSSDEVTRLDTAKTAWTELMASWQATELHKFGPVANNDDFLQNRVLSYAKGGIDTCGIDRSIVNAQSSTFDLASKSTNQKGLGSVEYVLFNSNLTHTCPSQISETQDWDSKSELERKQWRCHYARIVADDVSDAIATVISEWEASGGDFRSVFINPLNSAAALEMLKDGLFYMDTVAKDKKLGVPLGISNDCSQFSCPEQLESYLSRSSLSNVKVNIQSFKALLTGNGGLGIEALVSDAGVPEVSDRLLQYADAAIAEVDSITESAYDQAIAIDSVEEETECTNAVASPDTMSNFKACNVYGHIKKISDELKIGFVAAIGASIPESAQADND